jgi:hypothetical protein
MLPALVALCATVGACAPDAGDAGDAGDRVVDESEEALKNTPIAVTKVCVRVKRDTTLFLHPKGDETIKTPSKEGAKLLAAGPRYVLVQRKPGRVGDRVWVDADLYGLRSTDERDALAKRCGISTAAATKAVEVAIANEYVRRGWVDVDDLGGNLRNNLGASLPNGAEEGSNDGSGSIRTVKEQCLIQGAYRGGSNTRATGLATYGTCAQWKPKPDGDVECTTWGNAMYINYGTPEIDGGGVAFDYLAVGQKVHSLRKHVHEQNGDHCQVDDDAENLVCNSSAASANRDRRIWWAEVWARSGGRTVRGWVPNDCLAP